MVAKSHPFQESLDYLLSLGNEVSAMKLGLDDISKLLSELGKPAVATLKVQVAGTNGKGSVCAFLNSICLKAGIKTGLYTSPHLISITERIKINGVDIEENEFAAIARVVRDTAESLVEKKELVSIPTFFEQVTAIALIAFARHGVELIILETGLGGRLDATTAANAEIAAITRIDYDHQEYLGETLREIAAEKAAIIHEGSKVVIGDQPPEAMGVIIARCANLGIRPRLVDEVRTELCRDDSLNFVFETLKARYENIELGLAGKHQIENAKIAVLLAEALQADFDISPTDIIDGLRQASHPGRLEFRDKFLFDGAHNLAGARALRAYFDEFIDRPITIIFGAMKDKDAAGIAKVLFPKTGTIVLTQPDNTRAMTAAELANLIPSEIGDDRLVRSGSVSEAIGFAQEVSPADGIILITGSLYLVGEARRILTRPSEQV